MIEYPTCYVLKHKVYGTYVKRCTMYALDLNFLSRYSFDKREGVHYYTDSIASAKQWSSVKIIKRFLVEKTAPYFEIVGSDKTIIDAGTLFL